MAGSVRQPTAAGNCQDPGRTASATDSAEHPQCGRHPHIRPVRFVEGGLASGIAGVVGRYSRENLQPSITSRPFMRRRNAMPYHK